MMRGVILAEIVKAIIESQLGAEQLGLLLPIGVEASLDEMHSRFDTHSSLEAFMERYC